MDDKLGNIKAVLRFIIGFTEGFAVSLADGKLDASDILNFWEPIKTLPDLTNVMDGLADTASGLSTEEISGLVDWVKDEFDIPQDGIEATVEAFLDCGIKIMGAIQLFEKARKA